MDSENGFLNSDADFIHQNMLCQIITYISNFMYVTFIQSTVFLTSKMLIYKFSEQQNAVKIKKTIFEFLSDSY